MKKSILKMTPYLLLVMIAALICSALEGLLSLVLMRAVDLVTTGNRDLFTTEVTKLLLIALILIPITIILSYTKGLYKIKTITSLKVNYISRVFNKNINEFQRDNNSKYVSTLTNDVNTIESNYVEGLYEVVVHAMYLIVSAFLIGYVSPLALGLVIVVGLVSTLISLFLSKPLEKHHTQRSTLLEGYTSYIKEVISAFHIIKANNLKEKVQKDFYNKSYAIQNKAYVIDKIYTYISSLQNLNMIISMYILLGITAFMAIKGSITLGGAILVVTNMERVMFPLMQMSEWMPKIFSSKSLFEKIDRTLKNQDNYDEAITIEGFRDSIKFSNVTFGYEDGDVLSNINLSFNKGGKYLIVGPSGGGKSTLLKLLRKYFSPLSGTILMDGNDLRDITKASFFKHISNVEQNVFLFEDTVKNNITLFKGYSEDEIAIAISRAGLRDFIDSLPQGLDTIIYDNGKNISGGEKSRIAIARGLLRKADIIFLDEAFASLDSKIAKEIENTILNLEGVTVINVSHVIFEDTKRLYDKVYVVKNKDVSCA